MLSIIPRLSRIRDTKTLEQYAADYCNCSGLSIPTTYLQSKNNRVFGVFWQRQLVGGFILGADSDFRTLHCFARPEAHDELLSKMGEASQYAEITCFFIQSQYRTITWLNLYVWLALTFCIRIYGRQGLLFGTNSPSLAKLYGQTHHSRPFHKDRIGKKRTFLFLATRRQSVKGMLEIIRHKLQRSRELKKAAARRSMATH